MMNVLRQFKLWQKFAVLGAASAVACAVPLYFVYQAETESIKVAQMERAGLPPVRHALALSQSITDHRGPARRWIEQTTSDDSKRLALAGKIEATIKAARQAAAEAGFAQSTKDLDAIETAWKALAEDVSTRMMDVTQAREAHASLVRQTMLLIEGLADESGLSLDPVAASYYLMTAATDHMPRLSDALIAVRVAGVSALDDATVTEAEYATLRAQLGVAVLAAERGNRQVAKAVALESDLGNTTQAPQAAVEAALKRVGDTVLMQMTPGPKEPGMRDAFFAVLAESVAKVDALNDASLSALDTVLAAREATFRTERATYLGGIALLLLLCGGLAVAITRSVTRPLTHAVHVSEAIGNGDLDFAIDTAGRDEAAEVLRGFAAMQQSLRNQMAEREQRTAEATARQQAAEAVAREVGVAVDAAVGGDFSHRIGLQ
ncbi:MAG: HAMP domain-containing protein, partial [Rhodoferax sp.]|nr:HAMP domain-containing protein [Rhodoferax sp.]